MSRYRRSSLRYGDTCSFSWTKGNGAGIEMRMIRNLSLLCACPNLLAVHACALLSQSAPLSASSAPIGCPNASPARGLAFARLGASARVFSAGERSRRRGPTHSSGSSVGLIDGWELTCQSPSIKPTEWCCSACVSMVAPTFARAAPRWRILNRDLSTLFHAFDA